jgi:hypothetical protein
MVIGTIPHTADRSVQEHDNAYAAGTERSYNALRLAGALSSQGEEVRVFLRLSSDLRSPYNKNRDSAVRSVGVPVSSFRVRLSSLYRAHLFDLDQWAHFQMD